MRQFRSRTIVFCFRIYFVDKRPLHDLSEQSHVSNLWSIPTDCPQREKRGWMGDAGISSNSLQVSQNGFYQVLACLLPVSHGLFADLNRGTTHQRRCSVAGCSCYAGAIYVHFDSHISLLFQIFFDSFAFHSNFLRLIRDNQRKGCTDQPHTSIYQPCTPPHGASALDDFVKQTKKIVDWF